MQFFTWERCARAYVLIFICIFINLKNAYSQSYVGFADAYSIDKFYTGQVADTYFVKDSIMHVVGVFNADNPSDIVTDADIVYGSNQTNSGIYYFQWNMKTRTMHKKIVIGGQEWQSNEPFLFSNGNEVAIVLTTGCDDLPVTNGSQLHGFPGYTEDVYVMRLNINSGALLFASYIGGGAEDYVATAKYSGNHFYLLGTTRSQDFDVLNGQAFVGSETDAYLVKIDLNSNQIVTSSCFNFSDNESITYVGDMHVNGNFLSLMVVSGPNYAATSGTPYGGGFTDAAFLKINTVNGTIQQSELYGGSGYDFISNTVLKDNRFHCLISTASPNFPVTDGTVYQNADFEYVYAVVDANNGQLQLASFLNRKLDEFSEFYMNGNHFYMATVTSATNKWVSNGSTFSGLQDIHIMQYNALTGARENGFYLGGNFSEQPISVSFSCDDIHIVGNTYSTNYPVTNGTAYFNNGDLIYTRIGKDGTLKYSTYISSSGGGGATKVAGFYEDQFTFVNYVNGLADYPLTVNRLYDEEYLIFTQMELCGKQFYTANDTLTPSTGNACAGGYTPVFRGREIVIPSDSMPMLYRNGVATFQNELKARYQWQMAENAAGPWSNIAGANSKDYKPESANSTKYFRRLSLSDPCCGNDTISISSVAMMNISNDIAPTVSINSGIGYNTCPGVPVDVSASVSGGAPGYTYRWFSGSDTTNTISTAQNFTFNNTQISSILTLYVTDQNACVQVTQGTINVHKANAGPDMGACAGNTVTLKTVPVQGLSGTQYQWSPASGLSCTTCIFPQATPPVNMMYVLEMTIPTQNGTCSTLDTVKVEVVSPPPANFGGADQVICFPGEAELGSPLTYDEVSIYAVSQSSAQVGWVATAENLSDGNFATGGQTNFEYEPSIIIDLGSVKESISRVQVGFSNGSLAGNIFMQYSVDNVNWEFGTYISGVGNNSFRTVDLNVPVTARYLKFFRWFDSGVLGLGEVKIFQSFKYTWTPGAYLNANQGNIVYYNSGTTNFPPQPDSAVYYVTAQRMGCFFSDTVVVDIIRSDPGTDGCGPRIVGGNSDVLSLNETFYWEVISGGGTITGPTNTPQTTVSASPAGDPTTYQLTTTYKGHTCTSVVYVPDCACNVDIQIANDVGCASTTLSGGSLTLNASPVGFTGNVTYAWSPEIGANGYHSSSITITDTTPRTYTVTITSVDDSTFTCSGSIDVNLPNFIPPVFKAVDTIICPGMVVEIGETNVVGYNYEWVPYIEIDNNGVSNPLAYPSSTIDYMVTVTDAVTGCKTRDTASVEVRPVYVNAGPDWEVCNNAIATLGSESPRPGYSYAWTPAAPWQNGTDSTFSQPEVLVAASLNFVLTATDNATGCTATDDVNITVNNNPVLNTYGDVTICKGDTVQFAIDSLPGVSYLWSPPTGLSSVNVAKPFAFPESTTVYTLSAIYPGFCNTVATTQFTVYVNEINFSAPDINFCPSNGIFQLGDNVPAGYPEYIWTPFDKVDNPYISNPSIALPLPTVPTDFVVLVSDYYCNFKDTIRVIPSVVQPIAGSNKTICLGQSTTIGSTLNASGSGITYDWSPATGLSCTDCLQPVFTPASAGDFTFTLTRKENGCATEATTTVTVRSFEIMPLSNTTVCSNTCVSIGPATAQTGVAYFWSPSTGLSSNTVYNPMACPGSQSITYQLTATDAYGCSSTQSTTVNVSQVVPPSINMVDQITVSTLPAMVYADPVVNGSGNYQYFWAPNDGSIADINALNPMFLITSAPKSYQLEVTDAGTGCQTSDMFSVAKDFAVLPVEWLSFDVIAMPKYVVLNWTTASEKNNDRFEVERSIDGKIWEVIGIVKGNGTTSIPQQYSFIDENPVEGLAYYRIKQVDYDAQFEYSIIRSVTYESNIQNYRVQWFPHPANTSIRMISNSPIQKIMIYDMMGRLIEQYVMNGVLQSDIVLSHLPSGNYVISFHANNAIQTDKLIIQH